AAVAHFAVAEVVADGEVDIVDGGRQLGAVLDFRGEHQRIVDAQLDGRDVGGKCKAGQDRAGTKPLVQGHLLFTPKLRNSIRINTTQGHVACRPVAGAGTCGWNSPAYPKPAPGTPLTLSRC